VFRKGEPVTEVVTSLGLTGSDVPGGGLEFAWFGNVHERAARNGARHGTPVLTSPWINLFFRTGTVA
jgi:hypothetical protein